MSYDRLQEQHDSDVSRTQSRSSFYDPMMTDSVQLTRADYNQLHYPFSAVAHQEHDYGEVAPDYEDDDVLDQPSAVDIDAPDYDDDDDDNNQKTEAIGFATHVAATAVIIDQTDYDEIKELVTVYTDQPVTTISSDHPMTAHSDQPVLAHSNYPVTTFSHQPVTDISSDTPVATSSDQSVTISSDIPVAEAPAGFATHVVAAAVIIDQPDYDEIEELVTVYTDQPVTTISSDIPVAVAPAGEPHIVVNTQAEEARICNATTLADDTKPNQDASETDSLRTVQTLTSPPLGYRYSGAPRRPLLLQDPGSEAEGDGGEGGGTRGSGVVSPSAVVLRRMLSGVGPNAAATADDTEEEKYRFEEFLANEKSKSNAAVNVLKTKEDEKRERRKQRRALRWKRVKASIKDFSSLFMLWRTSMKRIEGACGASVLPYFMFVRWLFLINVFICLMLIAVVVLPQAFVRDDLNDFSKTIPCHFDDSESGDNNEITMTMDYYDVTTPYTADTSNLITFGNGTEKQQACLCSANYSNTIKNISDESKSNVGLIILDIISGTGLLELTYIFIGYYYKKEENGKVYYDMPSAWLMASVSYFLVILILVIIRTSRRLRLNTRAGGGVAEEKAHRYSRSVLGDAWDHSLTSGRAVKRRQRQLHDEYVAALDADQAASVNRDRTTAQRWAIVFLRILVVVLLTSLIAGAAFLIIWIVSKWTPLLRTLVDGIDSDSNWKDWKWFFSLVVQYLPSVSLTVICMIFPILVRVLLQLAYLSPAANLLAYLLITVIFRLSSVVFIVIPIYARVNGCGAGAERFCGICVPDSSDIQQLLCWETYLGQQMYTLAITDFIVTVLVTFLVEFPRSCLTRRFEGLKSVGPAQFDIAECVLAVVYTQTICWIGGFFSPLIPAITVIKLFIFFYLKKLSMLNHWLETGSGVASHKSTSKMNMFFILIFLIAFVLSFFVIVYAIGRVPPSQSCGPFRVYGQSEYFMYQALRDSASNTLSPGFINFIFFIFTWKFGFILSGIFVILLYVFSVLAACSKELEIIYRKQLELTAVDQKYLMQRVKEAFRVGLLSSSDSSKITDLPDVQITSNSADLDISTN